MLRCHIVFVQTKEEIYFRIYMLDILGTSDRYFLLFVRLHKLCCWHSYLFLQFSFLCFIETMSGSNLGAYAAVHWIKGGSKTVRVWVVWKTAVRRREDYAVRWMFAWGNILRAVFWMQRIVTEYKTCWVSLWLEIWQVLLQGTLLPVKHLF